LKQAVISPSALSLMYPEEGIPGHPREAFIEDLLREHVTEVRRCLEKGCAQGADRLHRGPSCHQDRPVGGLLGSFIDLNNLALARFTSEERALLGVHTCPGGDRDSTHSADVDYADLLPCLFQLNVGNFYCSAGGGARPGARAEDDP